MPFAISGNVDSFEKGSLRNLEKHLGIILSENQTPVSYTHLTLPTNREV